MAQVFAEFEEFIEVQLKAISPVAFMVAKAGDTAVVKKNPPKPNEYRDKIGPAAEALLVFKGETKIGMIPHELVRRLGSISLKRVCRISKMDRERDLIQIRLFPRDPLKQ